MSSYVKDVRKCVYKMVKWLSEREIFYCCLQTTLVNKLAPILKTLDLGVGEGKKEKGSYSSQDLIVVFFLKK